MATTTQTHAHDVLIQASGINGRPHFQKRLAKHFVELFYNGSGNGGWQVVMWDCDTDCSDMTFLDAEVCGENFELAVIEFTKAVQELA